ncbi:MAG: alcohol dehydrogenase catalytic domain-containing protein [Microthrixaceae bacterium]
MAPTMTAAVTLGNGGYEMIEMRQLPIPEPGPGEVRIRIRAAGINNTDINTRLGWYSSGVTDSTGDAANEDAPGARADGGWSAPTPWPSSRGPTVAASSTSSARVSTPICRVGVIVRACMRPHGFGSTETRWMGSDFDGAFAEHVAVPATEVFPVDCDWSDAELGAIPCAYATAENMIQRRCHGR